MDDRNFDEFVKGRLDGYEDLSFDPAALEGFHAKLASIRPMPWYEQQLSQYMMAASLTLFTVVNLYLFWPDKKVVTESHTSGNNTHQTIIDSLTVVIAEMKMQSQVLVKVKDSLQRNSNLARVDTRPVAKLQNGGLFLGQTSGIPSDLYHALIVKRMLITDNGEAYLIAPEKTSQSYAGLSDLELTGVGETYPWPVAGLSDLEMKPRTNEEPETIIPEKRRAISSKMRNALEKHYSKGIGINLAPHADLAKNVFSSGDGGITPKLGIVADWVLSPTLSVETGIDYSTTVVNIARNFQDFYLPDPDASLGDIEQVRVRNSLLSAPLAIKYRQWVSEKSQAFLKIGYTPYVTLQQEYQTDYDFNRGMNPNPGPGPGPGPNPNRHVVNSIRQVNDRYYYGNTATAALGLTKLVKNNNKLEASLFYEKSLASVGQEKLGMQLFGLRTAYWFNLR